MRTGNQDSASYADHPKYDSVKIGVEMNDLPSSYRAMSKRELIKWTLNYTKDWAVETFRRIPDERLASRAHPSINSAAWLFAHIAVTERKHIGLALEGIDDVPAKYRIFHAGSHPTDDQVSDAYGSKEELIAYWQDVRAKTEQYLDSITDEDLCAVSPVEFGGPNRHNPRREWFVMTIQHQNYHWGQLAVVEKIINST
jgi:uncharacterized damage-inducible protein DinB